jgi:hypothetical protein
VHSAHRHRVGGIASVVLAVALMLTGCASETPAPSDVGTRIRATTPGHSAATPSQVAHPKQRSAPPKELTLHHETSRVVPIGVGAARELEIPGDVNTLGWWTGGATPGATAGFVVITGHATREGTGAANAWWTAKPGDVVTLKTPRGKLRYRVVSRSTYQKDNIPLTRWFPSDGPHGPAGLALITCADYRNGEWRANTVVEAVPA